VPLPVTLITAGIIFHLVKYRNHDICRLNDKGAQLVKGRGYYPFSDIEIFQIYRIRGPDLIKVDECVLWINGEKIRAVIKRGEPENVEILKKKMKFKSMRKTLIYRTYSFT
jgi:hypothetical protein